MQIFDIFHMIVIGTIDEKVTKAIFKKKISDCSPKEKIVGLIITFLIIVVIIVLLVALIFGLIFLL